MRKGSLITHVHIQKLNPSTPKISLVILLNICDTIINNVSLENLVMDQLVIQLIFLFIPITCLLHNVYIYIFFFFTFFLLPKYIYIYIYIYIL